MRINKIVISIASIQRRSEVFCFHKNGGVRMKRLVRSPWLWGCIFAVLLAAVVTVPLLATAQPLTEKQTDDILSATDAKFQICGELSYLLRDTLEAKIPDYNDSYAGSWVDEEGNLYWGVAGEEAYAAYSAVLNDSAIRDAVSTAQRECLPSAYEAKLSSQVAESAPFRLVQQAFSLPYLRAVQDATKGHLVELGISGTALLEKENGVEISLTDESKKDGVRAFLKQSCPGFDESAVRWEVEGFCAADSNALN